MKQILQSLRSGRTEVADLPCPSVKRGHVLIRTTTTLVSPGTERTLVAFGHASLLGKARAQPDRVKQVLDKVRTDGIAATWEAVFNKLDQEIPLGYCNVGTVIEVGEDVVGFRVGDRVVSNGNHAEVVNVPSNFCAHVSAGVSDERAAFAVLGAIGLEGIRLAQPTLGEAVVVTGLGVIGLLTVQLLRAHGCRVLGLDYDRAKLELARRFGAHVVNLASSDDPVAAAITFSRGRGADAVLITTSTSSNEPVHQAATMCRKRGRIILVGVSGLELSRADFYEKELSFQVSCSYGPGRYDPAYEDKGADYPVGFVRWTAQRNFEAVLDMLADGRMDVEPLITHRFDVTHAEAVYALVMSQAPALGILLRYPGALDASDTQLRARTIALKEASPVATAPMVSRDQPATLGFIGAGNYATATLIPAFRAAGARLRVVASTKGLSGLHAARKFGFEMTTTDLDVVLGDPEIDAVVITTRHDSHAALVQAALRAGKHVFVEKPLALSLQELAAIEAAHSSRPERVLMVGYNRRFAPLVQRAYALLADITEPKGFVMTVNAGAVPPGHWTRDPRVGGGRIVGEACHFIDLLRFLARSSIVELNSSAIRSAAAGVANDDQAVITLRFRDGSIGTIHYLANGHRSFPKERLEIFVGGRVLQLDNFRRLAGFGWPGFRNARSWRQDKGQKQCAAAFLDAIRQGRAGPIPLSELLEVGRVTLEAAAALR